MHKPRSSAHVALGKCPAIIFLPRRSTRSAGGVSVAAGCGFDASRSSRGFSWILARVIMVYPYTGKPIRVAREIVAFGVKLQQRIPAVALRAVGGQHDIFSHAGALP